MKGRSVLFDDSAENMLAEEQVCIAMKLGNGKMTTVAGRKTSSGVLGNSRFDHPTWLIWGVRLSDFH